MKREMRARDLGGKAIREKQIKKTEESVKEKDRRPGLESLSVEGGDPINQETRRSNNVLVSGEQVCHCMCEFVINC